MFDCFRVVVTPGTCWGVLFLYSVQVCVQRYVSGSELHKDAGVGS